MFWKENDQFFSFLYGAGEWCTGMRKKIPYASAAKYLLKKLNPKLVKPCPIYGRYDVEKFTFGRQFFLILSPCKYQIHFKLVDDETKAAITSVLDFEVFDH